MITPNQRLTGIILAVPVLLLIPLIAMRFTDEVTWTALDFVAMGVLLLVTGLALELSLRLVRSTLMRLASCGVIMFVFLMVWGELATGFFRRALAGH